MLEIFICPLLGLRQILTTESPLKSMKNAFYFVAKIWLLWKLTLRSECICAIFHLRKFMRVECSQLTIVSLKVTSPLYFFSTIFLSSPAFFEIFPTPLKDHPPPPLPPSSNNFLVIPPPQTNFFNSTSFFSFNLKGK